jgi:hypothetical protein
MKNWKTNHQTLGYESPSQQDLFLTIPFDDPVDNQMLPEWHVPQLEHMNIKGVWHKRNGHLPISLLMSGSTVTEQGVP